MPVEFKDYYATLEVARDASEEEIKRVSGLKLVLSLLEEVEHLRADLHSRR